MLIICMAYVCVCVCVCIDMISLDSHNHLWGGYCNLHVIAAEAVACWRVWLLAQRTHS